MKYFIFLLLLFPSVASAQEPNSGMKETVEFCMPNEAYQELHQKRKSERLVLSVSQLPSGTMAFSVFETADGKLFAARHYENGDACIMFVGNETIIKPGE